MASFKEALHPRDAFGKFAPSFKGGTGSLKNEIAVHNSSKASNMSADAAEADMRSKLKSVNVSPATYPSADVKNELHRRFDSAASNQLALDDSAESKQAIDTARKVLGFKGKAPRRTKQGFNTSETQRAQMPNGERTANNKLDEIRQQYDEVDRANSDHPANYIVQGAQDTLSGIKDGMGVSNYDDASPGEHQDFGPGPLPSTKMNRLIRGR